VAADDLTALTVLALLAEKPCHPYEMQMLIRQRRKDYAVGSARTLYRAVARLERNGLVEAVEISRVGNRPERTVYQITARGSEHFAGQLGDLLAVPREDVPAFTAAVGLLAHLAPRAAEQALQTRTVLLEGQIADLEIQLRGMGDRLHRLLLLELEYLLAIRRAELGWVTGLAADVANGTLGWDPDAIRSDPGSLVVSPGAGPGEGSAAIRVVEDTAGPARQRRHG
jgi:DNA-binding PadR family transcriptional regulator